MYIRFSSVLVGACFGMLMSASSSYGETKSTTVEQTSVQTETTPRGTKKVEPVTTTTTTYNKSSATVVDTTPRQVINQDTLKKISKTLCTEGFKAYVGTEKKNICQGKASSPDLAYSCVWDKKGAAAYAPSAQGPCALDFSEHLGGIIVTKENFNSNPPLSYGVEAQCCFRAAKAPMASN